MRVRTVFMGTPEFSVSSLQALVADDRLDVTLVLSQPDRPSGRGQKLTPPPVARAAMALGVPLWQPESLRPDEAYERLAAEAPALIVVAAYGQILRPRVLAIPRYSCINVHASLLPRWRGAAPIHRAIQAGDTETGVCIMRMEAGLDTGPVYRRAAVTIDDDTTTEALHDVLAELGARLLSASLERVLDPDFVPEPQADEGVTYATKLSAADRAINFALPARMVARHINAMCPAPGARVTLGAEPLALWRARPTAMGTDAPPGTLLAASREHGVQIACGDGLLVQVLEAQRPGRKRLPAIEAIGGLEHLTGTVIAA